MKKQFCISERPFGGDSQRDEKMVGRHCSKIQEDGDTEFFSCLSSGQKGFGGLGRSWTQTKEDSLVLREPQGSFRGDRWVPRD